MLLAVVMLADLSDDLLLALLFFAVIAAVVFGVDRWRQWERKACERAEKKRLLKESAGAVTRERRQRKIQGMKPPPDLHDPIPPTTAQRSVWWPSCES